MNDQFSLFEAAKSSTDWLWSMKNDYPSKNGLTVFSCFSCGGGSTMGYKLAGCDVIGNCEIDPRMQEIYKANHKPKYSYLMDIREFNKIPNADLPKELFSLDILDGSPPCTTFSMLGQREKTWGKTKKFREGQSEQTLDDLLFVFIDTVAKLRPRVVIMENVEGLVLGKAFQYVREIYQRFANAGYRVNHWLLHGEKMGVPQTRSRVFFIALRDDIEIDPRDINMSFDYAPIPFGTVRSEDGKESSKVDGIYSRLLRQRRPDDKYISDIYKRVYGKKSGYAHKIISDDSVCNTITSGGYNGFYRMHDGKSLSAWDIARVSTFPTDYDFGSQQTQYVCGMSVPPIMIKRIVARLIDEGVFDYKKRALRKGPETPEGKKNAINK